jgi:DNA-binding transcriptional ArsR family regulator
MMSGLRLAVLSALLLIVLAPSALAVPAPKEPLPCGTESGLECRTDDTLPVKDKVGTIVAPIGEKPTVLDRVGEFFAGMGGAIGGAFAAVGAAIVSALRGIAQSVLQLKPQGMSVPAFAGVVAGGTAVAATGMQAGLWYLFRRLLPLMGVPLFSRIEKDELLANQSRAKIFELIKHNPGVHLSEIARELDMAWGTTLHHLRKLRADRLVLDRTIGHHKCFFVNGSGLSQKQMEALSLVKSGTLGRLASFLEAHPRTSLKELSEALGISPPLAAFHVRKLEKAGLVHKVRDGKSVRLSTTHELPAGFFGTAAGAASGPVAALVA